MLKRWSFSERGQMNTSHARHSAVSCGLLRFVNTEYPNFMAYIQVVGYIYPTKKQ
jgi:hypothetical protein